jgi:hypothetical protein
LRPLRGSCFEEQVRAHPSVFYAPFVGLVVFDVATLAQWSWKGSAWALIAPWLLEASVTYDPPSLAAGVSVTTTLTATGAALGDFAHASFSLDLQGITLTAWVSAADTVSVRRQNGTAGAIDLANGTLPVAAAGAAPRAVMDSDLARWSEVVRAKGITIQN